MRRATTIVVMLGLIAGCGTRDPRHPPVIRYGQETCAWCRMLISEEPFAAALVLGDDVEKFDDLGCLVRAWVAHPRPQARVWVHDRGSLAWIDGRTAAYVVSPDRASPMGSGLSAFADAAAARTTAEHAGGRVVGFDELVLQERGVE